MKKTKPYKLTNETEELIISAVADGLSQKDAATLAGVSEDTVCRWKREVADFADKIRASEIQYKRKLLGVITKASEKDWKAACWILERRYKKEFSNEIRNEKELVPDFPEPGFHLQRITDRVLEQL